MHPATSTSVSRLSLLFIFLLPFCVFAQDVRHQYAAMSCCPGQESCCFEAIKNVRRVNACYPDALEERKAANCIQKKIYGQISLEYATIADMECCAIFDMDDNDVGGLCRSSCISSFATPSMSSLQKLNIIKHCRQDGDHENYYCVRMCQMWLRNTNRTQLHFPVVAQCNFAAMFLRGKMYLGREIPLTGYN